MNAVSIVIFSFVALFVIVGIFLLISRHGSEEIGGLLIILAFTVIAVQAKNFPAVFLIGVFMSFFGGLYIFKRLFTSLVAPPLPTGITLATTGVLLMAGAVAASVLLCP